MPLQVTLNGEPKELAEGTTLLALVESLGFTPAQVAVERNLDVVPRATYAQVLLQHEDRIEVVTFVGGG